MYATDTNASVPSRYVMENATSILALFTAPVLPSQSQCSLHLGQVLLGPVMLAGVVFEEP
jgi:hypothetical protein